MAQHTYEHDQDFAVSRCITFVCCSFVLSAVVLCLGCDVFSPNDSLPPPPARTPQGDLEWVMKRLDRALEMFQPSRDVGLRVKRSMTYEFIPAGETYPHPTALVTIDSKTTYVPDFPVKKKEVESEDKPTEYEPSLDPEDEEDEFLSLKTPKLKPPEPMVAAPLVPMPRIDTVTTYELNFVEGHWQMAKKPESKREQMWFDYALEQ